jgi:hypothetical protein
MHIFDKVLCPFRSETAGLERERCSRQVHPHPLGHDMYKGKPAIEDWDVENCAPVPAERLRAFSRDHTNRTNAPIQGGLPITRTLGGHAGVKAPVRRPLPVSACHGP